MVGVVGSFAARGLQLITQVALARALEPALLGLYAVGWAVLRIGRLFAIAGLDKGMVRFGTGLWDARDSRLRQLMARTIGVAASLGTGLGLAIWLVAPVVAERAGEPELVAVLRCFALALPLVPLVRVSGAATRLSRRMHFAVLSEELAQPAINLVLILTLLALGKGLWAPLIALPISYAVATALVLFFLTRLVRQRRLARADGELLPWRTVWTFSIQASLAVSFTIVMMSLDRLLVYAFRSDVEAGVYHAAAQLSSVFPMVVGAFGAIFGPMIVGCHTRGESGRLAELFAVCTKWGLYLAVPLFLLIASRAPDLLSVVFQPSFRPGHWALVILAAGQLVNAATGPVGLLLIMTGNQGYWFGISGLALALNVILDIVLIPAYGGVGAAIATATAVSVAFLSASVLAWKRLGVRPLDRRFAKILAAAVAAWAALQAWTGLAPWAGLGELVVAGLVTGVSFLGVIALFPIDPEERQWFGVVVERLKRLARGGRP